MKEEEINKLMVGDLLCYKLKPDPKNKRRRKFNWDGVQRDYESGIVVDIYWDKTYRKNAIHIEWMSDDKDDRWVIGNFTDSQWEYVTLLE